MGINWSKERTSSSWIWAALAVIHRLPTSSPPQLSRAQEIKCRLLNSRTIKTSCQLRYWTHLITLTQFRRVWRRTYRSKYWERGRTHSTTRPTSRTCSKWWTTSVWSSSRRRTFASSPTSVRDQLLERLYTRRKTFAITKKCTMWWFGKRTS